MVQGLTILIDDIEGRLPLNPTKQDVAFGEQAHGKVHKDNLFTWVGCVTKFFYEYHLAKFNNKRTRLTATLTEFGSDPIKAQLNELDRSHLTTFNAHFSYYAKKSIRIDRKTAEENVGADTHFTLRADAPRRSPSRLPAPTLAAEPVAKKRKTRNTPEKQAVARNCSQRPLQTNDVATNALTQQFSRQQAQNVCPPDEHDDGVQGNHPPSQISCVSTGQHSSSATVKQEVDAQSSELIVPVGDDEESVTESVAESVVSTKDEYKNLCQQLSLKLEQRKVADRKTKKENRRLKEEILELKREVERHQLLSNRVGHQ